MVFLERFAPLKDAFRIGRGKQRGSPRRDRILLDQISQFLLSSIDDSVTPRFRDKLGLSIPIEHQIQFGFGRSSRAEVKSKELLLEWCNIVWTRRSGGQN